MAQDRVNWLIQAPENLNFLVVTDDLSVDLSQSANSNASPLGRQVTSTTSSDNDVITITGSVYCLSCGGVTQSFAGIVPALKRLIERQNYTIAETATITCDLAMATNMILIGARANYSDESAQRLDVSMTWQAINVSGDIAGPALSIGGVQG